MLSIHFGIHQAFKLLRSFSLYKVNKVRNNLDEYSFILHARTYLRTTASGKRDYADRARYDDI